MTDLALIWDPESGTADLDILGGGLATDAGLRTAVMVSLFTDRRARPDDALPDSGGRRGWWGDVAPRVTGDQTGSRLWLLAREKITSGTLSRAGEYAREALAWLIEDGIAAAVEAIAEAQGDRLALAVTVTRPDGAVTRIDTVWSAT
ncbi:hypothetical protein GVN24_24805 [Rhizobium sp. CRIBSB]|nr:hypothetical protein [Rhizobium sp. CRIBSB]